MIIDDAIYTTVSLALFACVSALVIYIFTKNDKKTDTNSEKLGEISVNVAEIAEGSKSIKETFQRHEEFHVEMKGDIRELKKNIHQLDLRIGKMENNKEM